MCRSTCGSAAMLLCSTSRRYCVFLLPIAGAGAGWARLRSRTTSALMTVEGSSAYKLEGKLKGDFILFTLE